MCFARKVMEALPLLWAAREVLDEVKPREMPKMTDLVETRSWDCPKSPSGFCCLDEGNDPFLDSCLICGDPDERK